VVPSAVVQRIVVKFVISGNVKATETVKGLRAQRSQGSGVSHLKKAEQRLRT